MLTIIVPEVEGYDETAERFVIIEPAVTLTLEHSLVALSKWESKWKKPFLSDTDRSDEQALDYVRAMLISPEVSDRVLDRLTQKNHDDISEYIGDKMSATWFTDRPGAPKNRDIITAEIIYYWMIAHNVPFECQHWHLNRLLTLIRVCNEKNAPRKKAPMSSDAAANRRALNEARKKQYGTTG
jgi:hypothetical protein